MKENEIKMKSEDGKTDIYVVEWLPDDENIKGVIQISHGITEHMGRYKNLAKFFTSKGFAVIGNDDIGHGKSVSQEKSPMYFGTENSWFYVTKDFYNIYKKFSQKYKDKQYNLLGFSMGSFVVRTFLIDYPNENINKVVLVGTGYMAKFKIKLGKYMTNKEAKKAGENNSTPMINKLALENYNSHFKNVRTKTDWLCSNEEAIDEYINDPLVGKNVTCGLFRELLNGILYTDEITNIKKMNNKNTILLISGKDDAVGEFSKGILKLENIYKNNNISNVTVKIYDGLRHDILHEKNCNEIFEYIHDWILL